MRKAFLRLLTGLLFRITLIAPGWRPGRAAMAGLAATVVYSIAMEGDIVLTNNKFSDIRFLEGMLEDPLGIKRSQRLTALAWALHLLTGVALAEVYAAIAIRLLPGPGWLRGAIFGEAFIASAWVLTPLADKYHPYIKSGEMPELANKTSFLQNLIRHLAFGLALGLLYRERDEQA